VKVLHPFRRWIDKSGLSAGSGYKSSKTMGPIKRLRRLAGRVRNPPKRPEEAAERPPSGRRDPDYATLPGGDSVKEAADLPPDRARELAD
jgi:hypothetical protein